MNRTANIDKTSATLVIGELYRSSPRLVGAFGATLAGLVTLATLASIA